VDMLHGFPKVGISVDVHAYSLVKSTLVVDLVSRKGGSPKEFTAGETTIDPPVAFYIESPLRQQLCRLSVHDAPAMGVISTLDTSKAIMHARTRASVSGSSLVNVSKVLEQNETADDDFYAVVHYHGRFTKLTIATSCMVCNHDILNLYLIHFM